MKIPNLYDNFQFGSYGIDWNSPLGSLASCCDGYKVVDSFRITEIKDNFVTIQYLVNTTPIDIFVKFPLNRWSTMTFLND